MELLSEVEEKRLAELREKAAAKGYTPTEKAELAQLEEKAAGVVHVPVREEEEVGEAPEGTGHEPVLGDSSEEERAAEEARMQADLDADAEREANQGGEDLAPSPEQQ